MKRDSSSGTHSCLFAGAALALLVSSSCQNAAPIAVRDPVAEDICYFQIAYDDRMANERAANAQMARIGRGDSVVSTLCGDLADEYFPRLALAADAGDVRAIVWCLEQMHWNTPLIADVLQDRRQLRWWDAFVRADVSDEIMASVLRTIPDCPELYDHPWSGCEILSQRAQAPEVKALALETAAKLLAQVGEVKRSRELLRRVSTEWPTTASAKRALVELQREYAPY